MKSDQLKRLKELEKENQRLRKAASDLPLDKLILAEAAKREGLKVPQKAAQTGEALAQRRLIHPAPPGAAEPCLVL